MKAQPVRGRCRGVIEPNRRVYQCYGRTTQCALDNRSLSGQRQATHQCGGNLIGEANPPTARTCGVGVSPAHFHHPSLQSIFIYPSLQSLSDSQDLWDRRRDGCRGWNGHPDIFVSDSQDLWGRRRVHPSFVVLTLNPSPKGRWTSR